MNSTDLNYHVSNLATKDWFLRICNGTVTSWAEITNGFRVGWNFQDPSKRGGIDTADLTHGFREGFTRGWQARSKHSPYIYGKQI